MTQRSANRRRARLFVLAATIAGAACSSSDPGVSAGPSATLGSDDRPVEPVTGSIDWEECGDGVECGVLAVPLVHDDPGAGTIELAVERHLATEPLQRIGSLLVNPGGPGVGGLVLAEQAELVYGEELLRRFDIVAFDPRGVGESNPPIECVEELDPYFSLDPTPDDTAERDALIDASAAFAEACSATSGDELLANVTTWDAARDLDLIRRALGEETISYFGFSYGSELGATWATLFPETVRAAVLDSAAAPNASSEEQTLEDTVALETAFEQFLDDCAADPGCAFHNGGDPRSAYLTLVDALDAEPLLVEPGRPPVNEGVAAFAVLSALYDSQSWPELARSLAEAQDGDGAGLLDAYDGYLLRRPDGSYTNDFEGLLAINCLDDPGPQTHAEVDELAAKSAAVAPLLGRLELLPYVCADWPVRRADSPRITGAGAGPILVIGSSGDPITSIASSRKMADALEGGVLLTVEADQHIAYGVNACGDSAVERYLVELVVPDDGTVCS